MSEISTVEIKNMLDEFENDNDFIELRKLYETPNCFTIMGDKRREEWHSSFVCWLLDPNENHGLGKFPLVKFLDLVESKCEELNIDKTDVENMQFETEHSTYNKGRIDVLGKSKSLTLVIENKIKAGETFKNGKPQSNVYFDYCEKEYKNSQRVYVLLKASSYTSVENKNFIHVTYQDLLDEVIKPAYEKCEELKLEDTKSVLKQYALDISNPLSVFMMASTNKDLSEKIYKKHEKIISKIRKTMDDVDRDIESVICKFFKKYKKYINNAILIPLGKNAIIPKIYVKNLKGKELTDYLIDYGYIIPGQTKLYYDRFGKTFIIWIDENCKFWAGYYEGEYDASREVNYIIKEYNLLHPAAEDIENVAKHGTTNPGKKTNLGKSAYEMTLLKTGIKRAGEKAITIGDIPGIINKLNI